jgi:phage shock protein PspC (stress-responsive transcriptional regulator)
VHPEQAQLAELGDQLAGERSGLEPVGDVRHDPVRGELAHGVAHEPLVVGQLVVDPEQVSAGWFCCARHFRSSLRLPAASVCARLARAQPGRRAAGRVQDGLPDRAYWREHRPGGACGGVALRVCPLRRAGVRDNAAMSYMNGSGGGKVLVRRRDNRIVAGVCAGLADYTGIDVNLLRVIVAALTLFTAGTGVLAYAIAWLVIPEEGQKTSIAEDFVNKNRQS